MPKNITINSDKCLLLVAGCVFTSGSILFSQVAASAKSGSQAETGAAHMPAFEVATIRPSNPNRPGAIGLYTYPRGKIYAGESTLRMLVQYAFNVQSFQVSGGPRWMDEDKYEVVALPPATSKSAEARPAVINEPPNDEQRKMLQSLLIDRFGLKFHREIKEGPVYVLRKTRRRFLG